MMRATAAIAILIGAAFAAQAARAEESIDPTRADLRAFNVWFKVVKEEFIGVRAVEDQLLPTLEGKRFLKSNLHRDLKPDDKAIFRVSMKRARDVDAATDCDRAILYFSWALKASNEASTVRDPKFVREAGEYVDGAVKCERGLGIGPQKSKLREIMPVLRASR
jgi:hypothetical protein